MWEVQLLPAPGVLGDHPQGGGGLQTGTWGQVPSFHEASQTGDHPEGHAGVPGGVHHMTWTPEEGWGQFLGEGLCWLSVALFGWMLWLILYWSGIFALWQ